MRHLGIVASSAPQASAPTITIASTTNYNQNIATFNATVNPNGATTSVKFQYSLNGSSWTDSGTVSSLTGGSQSVYYNHSSPSLSVGTLYYVRAVATNSAGESTSSNTTFTTWSLKTYRNGPSGSNDTLTGSQTFAIPTVTPTGGTQVIPTVLDLLVVGGGGGSRSGWYEGGGGGGYRTASSRAFANTSTTTLSITIGGSSAGATGGTSTITASNFTTISATGGNVPTDNGGSIGYGGSTPANDNSGFSGGTGIFVFDAKSGASALAGGGGAGCAGKGGDASNSNYYAYGGNGGSGAYYSQGNFNVGPGGFGTASGTDGQTPGSLGANSAGIGGVGPYGKGGSGENAAGTIGVVHFKYYAA